MMRDRLTKQLLAALAVLGNIVGLRSAESDVTITLEGRWSGKFDPVRLGLTIAVVVVLVVAAFWVAINMSDEKEVVPPTATKTPHPQRGWLAGVEGGINGRLVAVMGVRRMFPTNYKGGDAPRFHPPITIDAVAIKRLYRGGHRPAS